MSGARTHPDAPRAPVWGRRFAAAALLACLLLAAATAGCGGGTRAGTSLTRQQAAGAGLGIPYSPADAERSRIAAIVTAYYAASLTGDPLRLWSRSRSLSDFEACRSDTMPYIGTC
ncbi:MAG TPA: hypothetical protein VHU62_17795 [Mycobacterium sp.]|nr:hypothetical protein [Mycobacterium sp.]